jgi:glycerophosphoryl diester phosphodiesterase
LHTALTAIGSMLSAAALTLAGAPAATVPDPGQAGPVAASTATAAPAVSTQSTRPGTGRPGERTTVVAHRGASGYAPENTLAAVDAAGALGVQWVEVDVQRTKDGALVLLHDTDLRRTTNVAELFPDRAPWKLSEFTAEEVAQLDAGSWFDESFAGEPVPSFGELLDRMAGQGQRLLLELKAPELYPGIEQQILTELGEHGWLAPRQVRHKLILQSFNADSVRTVHQLNPRVKTGFLGTPPVAELPAYAEFSDQINPRHTTVTAEYVAAVHALRGPRGRRLEVFVWTVDDVPTAVALAELGVDGIISNVPDVIRDGLKR